MEELQIILGILLRFPKLRLKPYQKLKKASRYRQK